MATAKKTTDTEIQILSVQQGRASFALIGETPLIMNRLSEKAKHELLIPKGRKTAADKANTLKHNPLAEFKASAYLNPDSAAPTRLRMLSTAIKGAMMTAALDIPGAKKSQIGRLSFVEGEYVDVYGVPKLLMSVVRSADMNRTPDVRTRLIVPKWAAIVTVRFTMPMLNETSIARLLAAGGMTAGIGDWRVEKGSGSYGQYRLEALNHPDFQALLSQGLAVQDRAIASPECYDQETADLLEYFGDETSRRGIKVPV